MGLFLFGFAFLAFWAGHPASALLMRCALAGSGRFSPRAALALSGLAALSGALCGLLRRGGPRAVPASLRGIVPAASLAGGVLGRALLLMFVARFPGSLQLARAQSAALLLLAALALVPAPLRRLPLPKGRAGYALLCVALSAADGFYGAGGMTLHALTAPEGVRRSATSAAALSMTLCAQAGALLLTLLCGAAQVFPVRMLALLAAGAGLGALAAETQKERGALHGGMRIALHAYLVLAALACIEQAV